MLIPTAQIFFKETSPDKVNLLITVKYKDVTGKEYIYDDFDNFSIISNIDNKESIENSNRNNEVLIESINNLNAAIKSKNTILGSGVYKEVKSNVKTKKKEIEPSITSKDEVPESIGFFKVWKNIYKKVRNE